MSQILMLLHETMKGVKDTLGDHSKKLQVLIRDALKGTSTLLKPVLTANRPLDDQPYEEKPMEDESTCTALYEIAMAKTKEEVDEWVKRMDVSLVFVSIS